MSHYDVYSYGVVSSSTLYSLKDQFPKPEGYAEIDSVRRMIGGEATNSSIVLARLGASVRLDGNWLGDDDAGRHTLSLLDERGIDASALTTKPGYRGVEEAVFAAGDTRTIFGTYVRLQEERAWNTPESDDIVRARVVCLDPFFGDASRTVASLAHAAGKPVITVDCKYDDPLLAHAAAVVIAESFLKEHYENRSLEDVFERYLRSGTGLVIFTFGGRDIWYAAAGEPRRTASPYSIEPVDTTGGGDSFRAGIVFGFLEGWSHERTIDFAAALAAIVCTRSPGVLESPTLDEVFELTGTRRPQ
ncbi:MAG: carbohydrate kinase family protein [Woeseiaceae bacterium]|nr:carbohydrate kinase family protein [Woeseiaceae bacterium]